MRIFAGFLFGFGLLLQVAAQEKQSGGIKTFDPLFELFELPGSDPGNSVQGILQDSVGFMWFATQGGLHRYDGRDFITFTTDPNNPNSLNSDYIESIYLDSKGILWLTHWFGGGMTSYDPETGVFKRYVHNADDPESIQPNETSEIIEDRDGYIWVGGSGGLSRLDPETGKFKRFISDPDDPTSLSDRQVRGLYVDKNGTLWVATGMPWMEDTLGGLNRYLPETESFERYIHDPDDPNTITNNKVRAMFEDSQGNFWIGTAGDGLHTLDKDSGKFTHYPHDPQDPGKISRPVLYNPAETILPHFSHISSIFEDREGKLWIASVYSGLNVYDPVDDTTFHFESEPGTNELKTNFIWQTFQSDDGTIWIATGGEGQALYKLKERGFSFPFFETRTITGDSTGIAHGITKDKDGKIWMGLVDGSFGAASSRLWRIDPTTRESQQIDFFRPNRGGSTFDGFLGSLVQDRSGKIWVGTNRGYFYGDYRNDDFQPFRPNFVTHQNFGINAILHSISGDIWVPNWNSGVFQYDPKLDEYEILAHDPADSKSLFGPVSTSIFEDSKGRIWVGGGTPWYDPDLPLFLDRFDPQTKTFEHFIKDAITNGSIADITEDQNGNIWFIDSNDGLYKLDPRTKALRKFTSFNSLLPRESLHNIFTHPNGDLWIGADHSIIQMDPELEKMSVYNELHGVKAANNFWGAGWLADDGEILMARSGGFHAFHPDTLLDDVKMNMPDLRITGFRLLDDHLSSSRTVSNEVLEKPIWKTSAIELESFQNVFLFSVACFDFYQPDANQIQFMLEGYDRGWREDIRDGETPYYVNVSPGEYTFRLRGANSLGVWNKEGITLKVTVMPPWFKTWWAYTLYGIVLIGGVVTIDRLQRRRVLSREREKNRQHELAQAREIEKAYNQLKDTQQQLIHAEKMASLGELTAGIAHEIQNPLNFVNNFSDVNREMLEELMEEIQKGNFEEVKAIADDLIDNETKITYHGKRAEDIVKSMLLHSRGKEGTKEPVDINSLCDEYIRLAYHGFRARDKSFNADFKLELDDAIPLIDLVPQDIGRVLVNLINNAFQAVRQKAENSSDAYNPKVSVQTRRLDEADAVEIRITDNGNGIPDDIKEKIFQPFFTTKPAGQGTGLGLSLSYDIVKAHGGEIILDSQAGAGTCFIIKLPVVRTKEI